jgi:hypothetical protein
MLLKPACPDEVGRCPDFLDAPWLGDLSFGSIRVIVVGSFNQVL